ncbi:hypothetical protein C8F04DRAFT_444407 [Mycena alexandri]|uniref:BAG domain-containing protein n=1 Tax=Mycena alexandri TaxID=1745969 RepID=A0AAD6TKT5_9AGAR|nr:hypothetical protein C8F04DRAFT_444407 [Mycena alexandri]
MTQNTLPLATPIPHYLATEVLDKSAGNWAVWEKTILSCLTLVGLEGYPIGDVPCPNPATDPSGATNWRTNDRAVVSFLILKASPVEQQYIAIHAAAGAKAVWDALLTRHSGATLQIRLIHEAFGVRYGAEPPTVTSARIDALATRIFALGPINKATLVSAVMVHAVQGDLENFAGERRRASTSKQSQQDAGRSSAEQAALSAIMAELTILERELSPAVSDFLQATQGSSEEEWTRLLEQLFQVLGRLDAVSIAPTWIQATAAKASALAELQRLQSKMENSTPATPTAESRSTQTPLASEAEKSAIASIATEMTKVHHEFAPAVVSYLQRDPDAKQRSSLIEVLAQSLARLDAIVMQPDWEGKFHRSRAIEEVLTLLNTLGWLPALNTTPPSNHNISKAEQVSIALIVSEVANVQNVLAPAVATFPRSNPQPGDEKERRDLSKLLFETVQRLEATHINLDWERARNERTRLLRAVQKLKSELDTLPACTEEQVAIDKIAAEQSKIQLLLFPAVTAYLGNPTEKERLRLSELLFQAIERLDEFTLPSEWERARTERREAIHEVQRLHDNLAPPIPARNSSSPQAPQLQDKTEENAATLVRNERSRIQYLLAPTIHFFSQKPNAKERTRLSELLIQALERLDGIVMEPEWEACRQSRRTAVHEVQKLQDILDVSVP